VLVARCEGSLVTRRICALTVASFPSTDQPALDTACKRDDCRDCAAPSESRRCVPMLRDPVEIKSHPLVVSKGWERQKDNSLRAHLRLCGEGLPSHALVSIKTSRGCCGQCDAKLTHIRLL
jgi:hypothetical protein